jgi:hypothetical protein
MFARRLTALCITTAAAPRQATDGARPLSMSGWEDLIEEAGEDLERVEGHVTAAAGRLVALQVFTGAGGEQGHGERTGALEW